MPRGEGLERVVTHSQLLTTGASLVLDAVMLPLFEKVLQQGGNTSKAVRERRENGACL